MIILNDWVSLIFFLIILMGISIVSIHYRKEYEKLKRKYYPLKKLVNKMRLLDKEQKRENI